MAINEEKNANFVSKYKPNTLTIRSFDKLNLTGYEYMNEQSSHKWAIVVHGYNGRASEMTKYIRNFYEQGYNVIAPIFVGTEIVKEIMLVWAGMIVKIFWFGFNKL